MPSNFRSEPRRIPGGFLFGCGHGLALLGGHLKKQSKKQTVVREIGGADSNQEKECKKEKEGVESKKVENKTKESDGPCGPSQLGALSSSILGGWWCALSTRTMRLARSSRFVSVLNAKEHA